MHSDLDRTDLKNAVDALTRDRIIHTIQTNDDGTMRFIAVTHPPLLTLLMEGTGITRSAKSSETKIPIDADALEIWGQIRDLLHVWSKQIGFTYTGDDLIKTVQDWHEEHERRVRAGHMEASVDVDVTRMVEGWVRMIEGKFDPPTKLEWKSPCVAVVPEVSDDGEFGFGQCGARRITLGGVEVFAIEVNVTTLTATCRQCGATWQGENELMQLRFMTNINERVNAGLPVEREALALWATRRASDTIRARDIAI